MASGGVGSNVLYTGTVEHVVKGFGFVRLDEANPVSRAFFDRSSVVRHGQGNDLSERFKKGCKIRAKIALTDGEHKVKFKAIAMRLATSDDSGMTNEKGSDAHTTKRKKPKSKFLSLEPEPQDESSIKGGDHYLKKYLENNGAKVLENLVQELSVTKDNCPRFLKNGGVNAIMQVVMFRPDWFEIRNGRICLIGDNQNELIVVDESSIRGGDPYLKKYLEINGAVDLEKLVEDLQSVKDNCPKFLRKGDVNEVKKVVAFKPDVFEIKSGVLCLRVVETELVTEIVENTPLHDGAISFDSINSIIRPDHEHRKYLHTSGQWNVGVKDFVCRNAETLVFWNEAIQTRQYLQSTPSVKKSFRADLVAVKYYSQFVNAKGSLTIRSLSGHFNQANDAVKAVASPREPEFREFLERNTFFFVLRGDTVKECPAHRLAVIDRFWLKKPKPQSSSSAVPPKPLPRSTSNPREVVSPPKTPERRQSQPKSPIQVSKAFSDVEAEIAYSKPSKYYPSTTSSHTDRLRLETSAQAQPSLLEGHDFYGTSTSSGDAGIGIYSLPEARIFKQLIGNPIAEALEDEILSNDTLNSLLLLRLNIGKAPMAKFRIPGEAGGYNHMMKTETVKSEDLQRMLRHHNVTKMNTPSHYGVKGTLHSIRTMEQAGKMTGLTLFCQLHEANDGLGLDVWKGKKLTAVFTGNYPGKYIYNHLRCKCDKLSKRGDVLVVDVDGQLSGCDEHPHSSLGNVTRMLCSSSSELSQVITDSIQHMHEYAVIIGIDSTEHLKAVQKMCGKDTQVIAEVASDLKSEVENLFS